ncbi:oligosaccharide flippase family protein [Flavobacterium luminosum]|uniref:Oligosaccharide flippase family protein n=1 Tax=Flavobacterium luminosum TaxID=2949086 RepID=A0ABT0TNP9_9FLAO|nr:oligosaccharide flippase family protein [Flavobacterium sp. HXWNR70]MCL9809127.1 oligosaccharide flippase family protein [Flavobacterium sp. HXWNR70]
MLQKKLIQNIFSLGIIQIVNFIFPLITIPYLSRIIGPSGYGIINYATAFVGYFSLLIFYGFDLTATRRISQDPYDFKNINAVFLDVINSRIILFIIAVFLFIFSLLTINPLQRDVLVSVILFIGTISSLLSPQYIFQGTQNLVIYAKINFIRGSLNTVLVFLLIKKPEDYYWIVILSSSFSILFNLFLLIYAIKKYQLKFKWKKINESIKLLYKESRIFLSTVLISLYTTTNVVILGFFADSKELGYYTTSQNFILIVISVLSIPISTSLFPYIGNKLSESREDGLRIIKNVIPIIFYIYFFASLFILIFAPFLVKLIYGDLFAPAVLALRITSFMPLMIGLSNVFGIQIMLNVKLDKAFFRITAICSFIGVLLGVIMSSRFGYLGTAWNVIIIETIVTLLMYLYLRKEKIYIVNRNSFHPKNLLRTVNDVIKIK